MEAGPPFLLLALGLEGAPPAPGPAAAGAARASAHVVEAGPHHLELVDQLLVQGAHFRVHELLVNGQPDAKDVDLQGTDHALVGREQPPGAQPSRLAAGRARGHTCSCMSSLSWAIFSASPGCLVM